jgi:hypothetical protein
MRRQSEASAIVNSQKKTMNNWSPIVYIPSIAGQTYSKYEFLPTLVA